MEAIDKMPASRLPRWTDPEEVRLACAMRRAREGSVVARVAVAAAMGDCDWPAANQAVALAGYRLPVGYRASPDALREAQRLANEG